MDLNPYDALLAHGKNRAFGGRWLDGVCQQANQALENCQHGDFPKWCEALDGLPTMQPYADLDHDTPRLGCGSHNEHGDKAALRARLMALHPWRKGPLNIAGIDIDTEWRSDWKWSRIAPHLDLSDARVLDIGCGNGYYGWRMLGAGADLVVGVDPTLIFVMQWLASRHFSGDMPNFVLPLGIEDLPDHTVAFDCVFSMGVLYHRRDQLHHLMRLKSLLGPDGTLVLETLVLPDSRYQEELVPEGRYARMRNVWSVPGVGLLESWLSKAGFNEIQTIHVGETTLDEQRTTPWMTFESLEQSLDPENHSLTIEDHPAPRRAVLTAR